MRCREKRAQMNLWVVADAEGKETEWINLLTLILDVTYNPIEPSQLAFK